MSNIIYWAGEKSEPTFGFLAAFAKGAFELLQSTDLQEARGEILALDTRLVVISQEVPDFSGFRFCERLRHSDQLAMIPVLYLAGRATIEEQAAAFAAGCDDFLTKPVSAELLRARVGILLHHAGYRHRDKAELRALGIRLDLDRHECWVAGKRVELWPKEFEVLKIFMQSPGKLLRRDFLAERIWEMRTEAMVGSRAIDVTIERLRKKLGEAGRAIETVRGYGFRFSEVIRSQQEGERCQAIAAR